jgi:hypothetical protein
VFEDHRRLEVTRRGLAPLATLLPEAAGIGDDLDGWLDQEDIPDGVPYLISPGFEYDVVLNRYFLRPTLVGAPGNTQLAVAREIRRFLDFLWRSRGHRGWRDATEADHDAYWYWRRRDPDGPPLTEGGVAKRRAIHADYKSNRSEETPEPIKALADVSPESPGLLSGATRCGLGCLLLLRPALRRVTFSAGRWEFGS